MQIDELENRVVALLRADGMIAAPRPAWRRGWLLAIPVLLALAATCTALLLPGPAAPEAERYMLALYSGPAFRPGPEGARATEYGAWARGHAAVVDGAELTPVAATLGPDAGGETRLSGYFVVRADGPAAAVALARTMPHLRYGGTVVVRRIGG